MAKKQDSYYFNCFIKCTDFSCQAAQLLQETMENFDLSKLPDRLSAIHTVEHSADMEKHELLNTLMKAFITPIDREDIMLLSQNIDELTDKLEDVLIRIYYNNIQSIQPDALNLVRVVCRCCEAVRDMMTLFADFKHSKELHNRIVQKKRRIRFSLTACTGFTPPVRILSPSSPGARSISISKSVRTPANMLRILLKA